MEKIKLIIEVTKDEMDELTKTFVNAKKTKLIPSYFTFDDFLHELVVSFSKMPKIDGASAAEMMEKIEKLKESFDENGIGNIFEDILSTKNKGPIKTEDSKNKKIKKDEEEYKS